MKSLKRSVDPNQLSNDVAVFESALTDAQSKNDALNQKQTEEAEVLQELAVLGSSAQAANETLNKAIDAVVDDYNSFRPVVNS